MRGPGLRGSPLARPQSPEHRSEHAPGDRAPGVAGVHPVRALAVAVPPAHGRGVRGAGRVAHFCLLAPAGSHAQPAGVPAAERTSRTSRAHALPECDAARPPGRATGPFARVPSFSAPCARDGRGPARLQRRTVPQAHAPRSRSGRDHGADPRGPIASVGGGPRGHHTVAVLHARGARGPTRGQHHRGPRFTRVLHGVERSARGRSRRGLLMARGHVRPCVRGHRARGLLRGGRPTPGPPSVAPRAPQGRVRARGMARARCGPGHHVHGGQRPADAHDPRGGRAGQRVAIPGGGRSSARVGRRVRCGSGRRLRRRLGGPH